MYHPAVTHGTLLSGLEVWGIEVQFDKFSINSTD